MILQNNILLKEDIRRVGCIFLALGAIVEKETGVELSPSEINKVWELSRKFNYIDKNNMMKNPDQVLKEFSYASNNTRLTISQVGIEKKGKIEYWKWAEKAYRNYKYKIEKVLTPGPEGTHFRLCDSKNTIIYDSYSFKSYSHEQIPEYTLYALL